jgi:hypothetical protein
MLINQIRRGAAAWSEKFARDLGQWGKKKIT